MSNHISGSTGKLTYNSVEYPITQWVANPTAELVKFATSASAGWKTGVPGSKNFAGTAEIRLQQQPITVGGSATLVLEHGHWSGTGVVTYTITATVTAGAFTVNVDTGEAISQSITFEALGAPTIAVPPPPPPPPPP
jgi:hypothetical protein